MTTINSVPFRPMRQKQNPLPRFSGVLADIEKSRKAQTEAEALENLNKDVGGGITPKLVFHVIQELREKNAQYLAQLKVDRQREYQEALGRYQAQPFWSRLGGNSLKEPKKSDYIVDAEPSASISDIEKHLLPVTIDANKIKTVKIGVQKALQSLYTWGLTKEIYCGHLIPANNISVSLLAALEAK